MFAISPQLSNFGWLLEDPDRQLDNNYYLSVDNKPSSGSNLLQSPTSQEKSCDFESFCDEFVHQGDADQAALGGGHMVKKLNHNASERDRRKKINELYSTLRSLLPHQDQSSKLSIPVTISRVLKYIPDLQNEVERLEEKRERFMSKFSRQQESCKTADQGDQKRAKYSHDGVSPSSVISATQISSREVIVQISVPKFGKSSLSQALIVLEQDGFFLLNATCTESSQGRTFCNLHLQTQGGQAIDTRMVKEKLLAFYERSQELH